MFSADMQMSITPPKISHGICGAGSGPPGGCNVCITNPPSEKCEWDVQKRK
jgi:hypothetical protein